jgi:hypothetical protein
MEPIHIHRSKPIKSMLRFLLLSICSLLVWGVFIEQYGKNHM